MGNQKHEFASPGWFEALHATIRRLALAAGPELEHARWAVCEVFTDVPAHIAQTPDRKSAWHCYFRGREISFGLGEINDADFKVVADYQTALPFAYEYLGNDPAAQTRVNEALMRAVAAGKMQIAGSRDRQPAAFATLHDEMARVTA